MTKKCKLKKKEKAFSDCPLKQTGLNNLCTVQYEIRLLNTQRFSKDYLKYVTAMKIMRVVTFLQ